ncbi:MAG: hypothetical protein ACRC3H_25310 [Lachnospiraceae bacterium]
MKIKLTVLLIVGSVMLLAGCSNQFANVNYSNEDKIASEYNTFNLFEEEQIIEGETFKGNAEIEGMDVIWTYDAEEAEDIDITYSLNARKGKAKIVLIKPDGAVETINENTSDLKTEDLTTKSLHLDKGENRIKLVASKGAEIEFDIAIPKGEFHELGF